MYILPLEGGRGEEPSLWEGLGGLLFYISNSCLEIKQVIA